MHSVIDNWEDIRFYYDVGEGNIDTNDNDNNDNNDKNEEKRGM